MRERLSAYVTYFVLDGIVTLGTGTRVWNRERGKRRGREKERVNFTITINHNNILKVALIYKMNACEDCEDGELVRP